MMRRSWPYCISCCCVWLPAMQDEGRGADIEAGQQDTHATVSSQGRRPKFHGPVGPLSISPAGASRYNGTC